MDPIHVKLGVDISSLLPSSAQSAIATVVESVPDAFSSPSVWPTAFHAAGTLNDEDSALGADIFIIPREIPKWLNTAMPGALLDIEPSYSRSACKSALNYGGDFLLAESLSAAEQPPFYKRIVGFHFGYAANGESFPVAFPCALIDEKIYPIIAVADTWRNDAAWENGAVPLYVSQQADFLMWAIRYFMANIEPGRFTLASSNTLVVRIIGNLPTDCSVRLVLGNAAREESVAKRVFRAVSRYRQQGIAFPEANRTVEAPYKEQLANLPVIEDEDLHELIGRYMDKRALRKALEAQGKSMKERQDAIAYILSEKIPAGKGSCVFTLSDGKTARVSHVIKGRRPVTSDSVTPGMILQYAPEAAHCVLCSDAVDWKVSIDAV